MVHEHLTRFFGGYRYDAHPMSMMVGVVGAMASYYHDIMNIYSEEDQDMTVRRILAKMPNIAAKCYKHPARAARSCIPTTRWATSRTS